MEFGAARVKQAGQQVHLPQLQPRDHGAHGHVDRQHRPKGFQHAAVAPGPVVLADDGRSALLIAVLGVGGDAAHVVGHAHGAHHQRAVDAAHGVDDGLAEGEEGPLGNDRHRALDHGTHHFPAGRHSLGRKAESALAADAVFEGKAEQQQLRRQRGRRDHDQGAVHPIDEQGRQGQLGRDDQQVQPEDAARVAPGPLHRDVDVIDERHHHDEQLDHKVLAACLDQQFRRPCQPQKGGGEGQNQGQQGHPHPQADGVQAADPPPHQGQVPFAVGAADLDARAHRQAAPHRREDGVQLGEVRHRRHRFLADVGRHHGVQDGKRLAQKLVQGQRGADLEDHLPHRAVQALLQKLLVLLGQLRLQFHRLRLLLSAASVVTGQV